MPDNYTVCVIGTMDRLWFHQIIIFSESISQLCPKGLKTPQPTSESLTYPSSNTSLPPLPDQQISSHSSSLTHPQCDKDNDSKDDEGEKKEMKQVKERPTRFSLSTSKTRRHSSSQSTQKRPKNPRYSSAMGRLENNMSCKSLWELELEEVKGFMDLGFIFKREQLSPRMMSVVPGLRRLGGDYKSEQKTKPGFNATVCSEVARDDEIEEDEEEKRGIMRPYLSEAWLIKRPDSPLLNLRIPRVPAAADMKKHLRFWARSVASEIHQES